MDKILLKIFVLTIFWKICISKALRILWKDKNKRERGNGVFITE